MHRCSGSTVPKKRIVETPVLVFSIILSTILLFLYSPGLLAGNPDGIKFFRNYPSEEYSENVSNFYILQDRDGVIYVANQEVLMMYDGVRWEKPGGKLTQVYSLGMDQHGTIYIGKDGDFGFIETGERGQPQYRSLSDVLPEEGKDRIGTVWGICLFRGHVLFRTNSHIYRYKPGNKEPEIFFEAGPNSKGINGFFVCGNDLYVKQRKSSLLLYTGDSFAPLENADILEKEEKILFVLPKADEKNTLFIGTRKHNFFLYRNRSLIPFPTEIDKNFDRAKADSAIPLYHSPGQIAIATLRQGIFIIDYKGRLKYRFSQKYGLGSNNIKHLHEDREGNIWVAAQNGISKIEYNSRLTFFDDLHSNLNGLPESVTKYNEEIYVGTTDGLFKRNNGTGLFSQLPGFNSRCKALTVHDNLLWAGTIKGVFVIGPAGAKQLTRHNTVALLRSTCYSRRIYAASKAGLNIIEKTGAPGDRRWTNVKFYPEFKTDRFWLAEDRNGGVWLPAAKRFKRIRFDRNLDVTDSRDYFPPQNKKEATGFHTVFNIGNHVLFTNKNGIYSFDEKGDRLVEEPGFANFAGEVRKSTGNVSKLIFNLSVAPDRTLYFHNQGANYHAVPGKTGAYTFNDKPFARIPISWQVNGIYPGEKEIWWATQKGLVRYPIDKTERKSPPYSAIINTVLINGKELVKPRSGSPLWLLEPDQRNFSFRFSAPFFRNESVTEFSYILEGYDSDWSESGTKADADYTNLPSGEYIFRVKAENVFGKDSKEAVFAFEIATPWYKQLWAFIIYLGLLVYSVYFAVRLRFRFRVRKLEKEKERLDREVNRQTVQLRQQNELLQQQKTRLKEMDQYKSRFFANISHEFRTPLSLIKGPLEELMEKRRARQDKENLATIDRHSRRLANLIDRLLTLSRLEHGKMKLKIGRIDVVLFLKEISAMFTHQIKKKKLTFRFRSSHSTIPFYCDRDNLYDIFQNLLSNAVKFTDSGSIEVVAESFRESCEDFPEGFMQVTVKDTGAGIPKEQITHIFDLFVEAGNHENRQKSFGIGLALTRELVKIHQGKINVSSRENSGTEFVLQFPLGKWFQGDMETEFEIIPESGEKGKIDTCTEEIWETQPVSSPSTSGKKGEPETILVVEDNADMRRMMARLLRENEFGVLEAEDGEDGIKIARKQMPDLVISDIMMPKIGGYDLCKILKTSIETSHIPVILLTARAGDESHASGLECGADDYVTKPFNRPLLVTRVKNLIKLRRELREKYRRQHHLKPEGIKASSLDDQFLDKLHAIIEKYIEDEDLNVDFLASKMEISRVTLNNKIKALTGDTANNFILNYRLLRARDYLIENAGTVTEIALRVGFYRSSKFSEKFKKKFKCTPTEYIKRYRNENIS